MDHELVIMLLRVAVLIGTAATLNGVAIARLAHPMPIGLKVAMCICTIITTYGLIFALGLLSRSWTSSIVLAVYYPVALVYAFLTYEFND